MEQSQKNLVDGLEHLVTICKDGEKGFKKASDEAKDEDLKQIFGQFSLERSKYVTELRELISSLGGESEQESDLTSALHRAWIDLKESLNGHDSQELLSSCKLGDEAALEAYNKFFGDVFEYRLSPTTHSLYTITGGRNTNYEATGMDSGNGLYNSSAGFSNIEMSARHSKSDYSSTSDENMNNVSAGKSLSGETVDENDTRQKEEVSNGGFSANPLSDDRLINQDSTRQNDPRSSAEDKVYSIVKAQLDGIEHAHNKITSLQDQTRA